MNLAVAPSSHWQISTRPTGEVLTGRISAEDVDLVVLGIPSGFTPAEVEGWLRDLLGVARETSRNDAGERPIPGLLHHILTGLLFSHAELWDRAGGTLACSCVFLRTGREVAFGWVGDRDPDVWIRGQRLEVEWVRVRDDEGREARAFAIDAVHPLELKLTWPNELEIEAEGRSIELTARWTARAEAPAAATAQSAAHADAVAAAAASQPSDSVFTMAKLSTIGQVPSETGSGAPLGIEPRESIEPEVSSEVQSPSWPPPEPPAALPETLPQDAPGLSFTPPALEPVPPATVTPAAARWEELARMMDAPAPPAPGPETDAPVLAIPHVPSVPRADVVRPAVPEPTPVAYAPQPEPTPVAYATPVAPPIEVAPVAEVAPVEADDSEWDLESGVAAQQYETPQPSPQHAAPAASQSGDWSVVYEGDGSTPSPGASRGKGLFGWVSGLLKRKPPKSELPTFEEAAFLEDQQVYEAPVAPAYVEPRPPALSSIEVPVAPPPPPVARVEVVAPPPPPVARVEPVAPPPPPVARVQPVAPRPPVAAPVARVTPPRLDVPVVAPPVASVVEPIEVEPVGAPAPVSTPRAPTTVSRAVAASSATGAREEDPVPWLDEQPFEPSPRARAAARAARPSMYVSETGSVPIWKKPWAWIVVLVALFGGGWLVGALQDDGTHKNGPGPMQRVLRGIGLGGARYEVTINSRPPGAWISVGGKDLARRTPATIDLTPGEHPVTLSFSDLGAATYNVRGERGDHVALDAALWGSLSVRGSDMSVPIAVSVDGKSLGFAPIQLDSLSPGPHEVRFSGPGMPSWSQTVTVKVGEASDVLARPMTSPATGVIDVRASVAGDVGSEGITGAAVYVDGVRRGSTPLTLELPRGPHSIRVEHQAETAPVQVIDLPGGNQRFATFEFGLDIERPTMAALAPPARIPMDRPAVISASLTGVGATEVREMWLHVRTPDETWRRYQMVMMKATGGVVGVAVFPPTMFDSEGNARWYVSASTTTGDDYFTELQTSQLQAPAGNSRR